MEKDPDHLAAVRRWSACMTRAGHPAKDLQTPGRPSTPVCGKALACTTA
ncbi:hypothetical protein OG226_34110 [Streptomyces sp. NBC_01261]|nr:hypothetical protein [Streptomyces sp. NBC_01261]